MEDATPLKQAGQDIQYIETRLKSAENYRPYDPVAQEHHDDLVTEVQVLVAKMQAVNDLANTETTTRAEELVLTIKGIEATHALDQQFKVVAALVGMDFTNLGG